MPPDYYFCKNSRRLKKLSILFLVTVIGISSCTTNGLFEKNVAIPNHAWDSRFQPTIQFDISDTTSLYRIYIVLRHTDAYRFKNLWLNIGVQPPGDSIYVNRRNLLLASDEKGWLGKGMDDIFEHRLLLNEKPAPFRKKGTYTFTLKHLMREDPLENIMNAGIRIEKVTE